jgi:transcriptional regulator with XRE-family HTH domain
MLGYSTQEMRQIGNRFRICRLLLLKTQADIAKETELPGGYIDLIEKGIVVPEPAIVSFLSRKYGLNLTWLIYGEDRIFYKKTRKVPRFAHEVDQSGYYKTKEFQNCIKLLEEISRMDLEKKDVRNIRFFQELINNYDNLRDKHISRKVVPFPTKKTL